MNDAITLDTTTQGRRVNADVMTLTTMPVMLLMLVMVMTMLVLMLLFFGL